MSQITIRQRSEVSVSRTAKTLPNSTVGPCAIAASFGVRAEHAWGRGEVPSRRRAAGLGTGSHPEVLRSASRVKPTHCRTPADMQPERTLESGTRSLVTQARRQVLKDMPLTLQSGFERVVVRMTDLATKLVQVVRDPRGG